MFIFLPAPPHPILKYGYPQHSVAPYIFKNTPLLLIAMMEEELADTLHALEKKIDLLGAKVEVIESIVCKKYSPPRGLVMLLQLYFAKAKTLAQHLLAQTPSSAIAQLSKWREIVYPLRRSAH